MTATAPLAANAQAGSAATTGGPGPARATPGLEELVRDVERLADPAARAPARAVAREVLALHKSALTRLLDQIRTANLDGTRSGEELLRALAADDVIGGLLLLHGLHPVSVERRIRAALAPFASDVEVVTLSSDGDVHLRVGRAALAERIEEALCASAPDADVVIEQVVNARGLDSTLVPVESLLGRQRAETRQPVGAHVAVERCEMCSTPLHADAHDHVVDPESRDLQCVCGPCAHLFDGPAARKRKRVPRVIESLGGRAIADFAWEELGLPIDVAFFFSSTTTGQVVAMYPGPAGAVESRLPLGAWERVVVANPMLGALVPDIEAVLVNRTGQKREHWRVSIDVAYALVGLIRKYWRGLGGGADAWREIDGFFARLHDRADAHTSRTIAT